MHHLFDPNAWASLCRSGLGFQGETRSRTSAAGRIVPIFSRATKFCLKGGARGIRGILSYAEIMLDAGTTPISAVLITLDAEQHLDRVLQALRFCDEILILDSGSRDRTREIALAHGARFEDRDFDGYGPQKRAAIAMARHDWILSIDADEILDTECGASIAAIDWSTTDSRTAFRILRRPFVGSREIRHGHWVPDRIVRLFHRDHNNFSEDIVHESVHPSGPIRDLQGSMRHYSYSSPAALFRTDYSRLKAQKCRREGRNIPGAFRLAIRADWAFFHSLIIRRGILDGPVGVLIAISAALNSTLGLTLAGWDEGGD